ncbi:MAG: hypothetical protein HFF39_02010 [Lawsonibacter sp.]|nr:hypothetical protein [Lawsonibacter sp.]
MKYVGILLGAILCLAACAPQGAEAQWDISHSASAEEQNSGDLEGTDMRREFCTIQAVQEDCFILKNAMEELYQIDLAYLNNFKEGDEVLLIYTARSPIEEGLFRAEVRSIFPDSSKPDLVVG